MEKKSYLVFLYVLHFQNNKTFDIYSPIRTEKDRHQVTRPLLTGRREERKSILNCDVAFSVHMLTAALSSPAHPHRSLGSECLSICSGASLRSPQTNRRCVSHFPTLVICITLSESVDNWKYPSIYNYRGPWTHCQVAQGRLGTSLAGCQSITGHIYAETLQAT